MDNHPELSWPALPAHTTYVEFLGRGLIIASIILFALAIFGWVRAPKSPRSERFGKISFTLGSLTIFGAFLVLVWLVFNRQYQFNYVFRHSDNWLPDGKRIASLWGGQEGSFLLWAVMAAFFALVSVPFTEHYRRWYSITYASFLAGLGGILTLESPFKLWQAPADLGNFAVGKMPPDGAGLNPTLVNWWMQIHPPTIFTGFGSLTVLFAFAMAALLHGDMQRWAKLIRPWALIALSFTGLGLCMGGFWAYETLGWGGFWMWDPVENVALVPWLIVAALIHGLFVQVARGKWAIGNALFAGLSFISFVYGTFLTRSGFLGDTSVHSFASMDRNVLWLLTSVGTASLAVLIGATIYRMVKLRSEGPSGELDEVSKLNLQNAYTGSTLFLTLFAVASGVGMSIPFFLSLGGNEPKVVEEGLYNKVTPWLFIPTVLLMAAGPYMSWRGVPTKVLLNRLSTALALSFGFLGVGMFLLRTVPTGMGPKFTDTVTLLGQSFPLIPWVLFLSWICLFGIMANVVRIVEIMRRSPMGIGSFLTHIGVITTLLGLIVSRAFQQKVEFQVQQGRPAEALGYSMTFERILGENFMERENRVEFSMVGRGEDLKVSPILFYTDRNPEEDPAPTVRPFILHRPLHDIYITLYPMVVDATEGTDFDIGSKRQFEGHVIEYVELVREGEAGATGTRFGARLKVLTPDGQTLEGTPQFEITENGPRRIRAEIGDYFAELVSMDAATKSAQIKLYYKHPVLPMEMYYKPLPGLVWWGTGIMTVGGLLAAIQRKRAIRPRRDDPPAANKDSSETPEPEDAAPATTQV